MLFDFVLLMAIPRDKTTEREKGDKASWNLLRRTKRQRKRNYRSQSYESQGKTFGRSEWTANSTWWSLRWRYLLDRQQRTHTLSLPTQQVAAGGHESHPVPSFFFQTALRNCFFNSLSSSASLGRVETSFVTELLTVYFHDSLRPLAEAGAVGECFLGCRRYALVAK